MRARKGQLTGALTAVAAVLVLAACGGSDGDDGGSALAEGGSGKPEQKQIAFGILPTPDYAPVKLAIQEGYFEDEGVDVTAQVMSPGGAVPGLVGGSLQVAGVNWISFLTAINRGVPLRALSEADRGRPDYAQIMVSSDSGIDDLEGLIGKKVGVVSAPGNCDLIPLDALARDGVKEKPEFVNLAIPEMPGTLQRGGVDAACIPQPLLDGVQASGDAGSVMDIFDGRYRDFPIVGYSVSAEFAQDNPNTIGALKRALEKALALARSNPKAVRQILPEYTQITPKQANATTLPTYPRRTDLGKLDQVAKMMERVGMIEGDVEVPTAEGAAGK